MEFPEFLTGADSFSAPVFFLTALFMVSFTIYCKTVYCYDETKGQKETQAVKDRQAGAKM